MFPNKIRQKAIVKDITETEFVLEVCSEEACAACKAKSACYMGSGDASRTVVVANDSRPLRIGQQVCVSLRRTAGMKAVLVAYAVPIIVIVASLLVLQAAKVNELGSGLITLGVLALYYIVLRLVRGKLDYGITVELETEN